MSTFSGFQNVKPADDRSYGVLGYLIVLNRQIHSYEMAALEKYLDSVDVRIEDTCLDAILRGADTPLSYSAAYDAFSKENTELKLCFLYLMYVLAYADEHFSESEESYIDRIRKCVEISDEVQEAVKEQAKEEAGGIREQHNTIFVRKKTEKKRSVPARIAAWFRRLFYKLFRKDKLSVEDHAKDYEKTIEACAEIAREDLELVRPSYEKLIGCGKDTIAEIRDYKRGLSLETGLSASVAKTVEKFSDILNEEVVEQTEKERISLEQKKRTISDFTISLIGRTKAGKSTLYSILTQQGKDRIGVGKQRTTRYNWVYQWNLLRIIDTPGIGSAEADGRKDEEIAESVLGESDIICFVVADDSILKDILDFIEKIASLNKPIIILLNHKENIRPEVKFRRYIENPRQWLDEEGEASLKGHEHRIRKYAEERDFGKLVYVFPVFLLAALMADEEEYAEHSELLWDSSNMQSFIDQLSRWILRSGRIKRSQTILDESVTVFEHAGQEILRSEELLTDQIGILKKDRKVKIEKLKGALGDVIEGIRDILKKGYDDLAENKALLFAEEYVGKGTKVGDDVQEKWAEYVKTIGFDSRLKSEIDGAIKLYKDKADRTVRELFEDFYYSVNVSTKLKKLKLPRQFDLKNATKLASGILSLAGAFTFPVGGWVLTLAGLIGSIVSHFLTSKEKKRQNAIDEVYKTIREAIEKDAPSQISATANRIQEQLKRNLNEIDALFGDLIRGLERTREMADGMVKVYAAENEKINKAYAWRIIQFLDDKNDKAEPESIEREILAVDRSEKNTIRIRTESAHRDPADKLENVIADNVIIERSSR